MIRLVSITLSVAALAGMTGCDVFSPQLPGEEAPPKPIGNDFESATPLQLDADGNAAIAGTVNGGMPDVFDLGSCNPGDRVIVTIEPAAGSLLDPTVAIFDTDGELFALNDDIDLAAGLLGSHVDETVWIAGDHYYLAISKFFFDDQGGDYDGTVRIERGGIVDRPPVQYLLLNFDGGSITLPSEGTIRMDPFDAADIDDAYAGKTDEFKAKIVETVRQNYQYTGLEIVTSDDPLPEPGTFSTIYFGGFSNTKFGLAESVDQGNLDRCDDGIVFTNGFTGDGVTGPFFPQPSAQGAAIAIGNVASHEAGHLLGLNHVADVTALMDSTGTASTLLADQEFKTAPLDSSVFPIGVQNAPLILDRVVPR